jgi:hypothetical protein
MSEARAITSWQTPTLVEALPGSDEFDAIWTSLSPEDQARIPRQPRLLDIGAALLVGDGPDTGVKGSAHRYRLFNIDLGGRPRRDRTADETLCNRLVAVLTATPKNELRGRRGRLTREQCESYLEEKFPQAPRDIVRKAIERFLRR